MPETYDAIVIGLGGMGSAAAYQLAKRGRRVLGLERFGVAHANGSSHGGSRIIRQAYFEDPAYVPLLLRAYELWEEIEAESGEEILTITGGLMMGNEDSLTVSGSIESAEEWGLDYEVLDAAGIRSRYPNFTPGDDVVALYEAKAGFVRPERSVAAHVAAARAHGADLRFEEPVLEWEAHPSGEGVRVRTSEGSYEAGRLVISAGPWSSRLLSDLDLPLLVERLVQFWFMPLGGAASFSVGRQPIYIWEIEGGVQFYGFPNHDRPEDGAKVAFFRVSTPCTPEDIDRTVYDHEVVQMRDAIKDRIPRLNGEFLKAATCMYTTTPDSHFIVSTHPEHPQVSIAAGFSGHGFKFVSVIGEILADLATRGSTQHPIGLFDPSRFAKP
jgi:sarcosine oxidase